MTTNKAATQALRRPQIHMIDSEAEALANLAVGMEDRLPEVSEMLLQEIDRAHVHAPGRIGDDVVTMRSTVEFKDEASGATREVQLVYPKDADIAAGRISIMTPIGAGLIGLRTGQSIKWPDRSGNFRVLTITRVTHAE